MILTKKDIRLFRIVCSVLCFISIFIILFLSKEFGAILLALSLFFLFAPHKEGAKIK